MSDPKDDKAVQTGTPGKATPEESEAMRRLQREADKMAEAGRKTEEKYDDDQGIFNKM